MRQWHADEPDERRRFCCFRAWVLQRLEGSDAGELAGRVISKQTYGKHFGSWAASIARAGLLEGISFAAFKRLVGTPRRYPVDVLERSLDRWARWADDAGRHLTIACLGEWRDEVLKDQWRHGVVDGVPGVGAVASRWGTFLDGLVAVGLISADEALRRRLERGDRLPVEEVAALVRAARREFGGQLSTAAYEDFRARKARELGRSVPSVTTVIDKLAVASFPEAVKVAERFGPTTTAETVDHDEEEL